MVEVTAVTFQNRKFLRPSKHVNEVILGVMGRGLHLYPEVHLIGYNVLSTHPHIDLAPDHQEVLSDFMEHFDTNISKEIGGKILGWNAKFWDQRYKSIPIVDEPSMEARIKYLLSNGVKEHLVERVSDWPGVNSFRAMTTGKPDKGKWYDRTAFYYASRTKQGKDLTVEDFVTWYDVPLSPPPCWAHLTEAERQERVRQLACEAEEEAAGERERKGHRVLGVAAILSADPIKRPDEVERRPAPLCHATSRETRDSFKKLWVAVVEAYRRASAAFRDEKFEVEFPEGTFRPQGGFVGWQESPAPI
jgi:hypothetical protein